MGAKEISSVKNAAMMVAPFASLVAFLVTIFMNWVNGQDAENLKWGLFNSTIGDLSDKYNNQITPSGWTFSIWGFIYTYQAIIIIYWMSLLCRKNKTTQEPLYRSPVFMSPWIAVFYVLNMSSTVGWLFAWDRESQPGSFGLLFAASVTLYICLGISFHGLSSNKELMLRQGLDLDIRLVIGIVHNGIGMYATWVTIATLLNLANLLIYQQGIELPTHIGGSVSLSVLALEIVAFAYIDNILLERHTRYLYTPYIVLHVALIGSMTKNWDSDNSNSIFTAGLLAIGFFATVMKIYLSICRTRKDPLYSTKDYKPTV